MDVSHESHRASLSSVGRHEDRGPSLAHRLLHDVPDIELGSPGPVPVAETARSSAHRTTRRAARVGPIVFLIATGACLGLSANFATLAGSAGLPPLAFLAWSVCGASVLLFALAGARGELPPLNGRTAEYFALSAFVTIAATNLIFVSATPHVGVGFVAPVAALPPLLTYAGALALGLERFSGARALGVVLALGGAGWIAFAELSVPDAATFWIGLTLVAPILLAIGNLYRTLRWPTGLSAASLAPGMLGAAALMLLAAGSLPHPAFSLGVPLDRRLPGLLVGAQSVVFAAQFVLLLELQRRGGPVYLSLIGSVGALVGVPVAALLLGERLPAGLALGAALIGLGVLLLNTGGGRRAGGSAPPPAVLPGRRPSRRRRRRSRSGRIGTRSSATARPDRLRKAPTGPWRARHVEAMRSSDGDIPDRRPGSAIDGVHRRHARQLGQQSRQAEGRIVLAESVGGDDVRRIVRQDHVATMLVGHDVDPDRIDGIGEIEGCRKDGAGRTARDERLAPDRHGLARGATLGWVRTTGPPKNRGDER